MRFSVPAIALCLGLLPLAGGPAIAQTAQRPAPATAAPAPTAVPASPAPASTAGGSDAAARHAKLTGCLKDAKAKKLLGPEKKAFIKNCVAAP